MKYYIFIVTIWVLFSCQKIQEENSTLVKNPDNAFSFESAKDWLDREIKENPEEDLLYFKRAQLYFLKNYYSLAIQDIDKSIKLRALPKYYLLKSKIIVAQDDTTDLNECLRYYERTKIDDFEYYNLKSNYLYKIGNYKKALEITNEGIFMAPFFVDFYRNKGVIYLALKDTAKGEKFIKYALEKDSTNPQNYFEVAKYYRQIHQENLSKQYLTKGLALNNLHYGLNQVKGDFFTDHKLFDSALVYYNISINSNPKLLETHFKRALTYMSINRYVAAEADLSKIIRFEPNNTLALKKIAICKVETGQYNSAEPMFNKLYALDSNDVEIKIYLRVIKNIKEKLAIIPRDNANLQTRSLSIDTIH